MYQESQQRLQHEISCRTVSKQRSHFILCFSAKAAILSTLRMSVAMKVIDFLDNRENNKEILHILKLVIFF